MAYKMNYTNSSFPFKMDLTKKKGLGPRVKKKKLTEKDMEEWNIQKRIDNQETFSEIVGHGMYLKNLKKKNK